MTEGNVLQAGSFLGLDMCVKIRAAAEFAVANGFHVIDATSFIGNQTCSIDPLLAWLPRTTCEPANRSWWRPHIERAAMDDQQQHFGAWWVKGHSLLS